MVRQRFIVNPLGEAYYGDNCLISSVNICHVAKKVLTPTEYKRWQNSGTQKGKLAERVNKGVEAEFRAIAKANMTSQQLAVYNKIIKLQTTNNSQFRVYGGIEVDGRIKIVLVTEFLNFVDQNNFWTELETLAQANGAAIVTMHEDKHLSHYSPPRGIPGERPSDEPPYKGQPFVYGPDHGRMERQVEMVWDITGLSLPRLKTLRKRLEKATTEMFNKHGVGVI